MVEIVSPERTAGDMLYNALKHYPCRCEHNIPYAGGHVEQIVTQMCSRCHSMRRWEELTGRPPHSEKPEKP